MKEIVLSRAVGEKRKIGQVFCKPIRQAPHMTFGRRKNVAQCLTQFCPLARSWIWIAKKNMAKKNHCGRWEPTCQL